MILPDKRSLLPSSSSQLPVLLSVKPPFTVIKQFTYVPHRAASSRKVNFSSPALISWQVHSRCSIITKNAKYNKESAVK